MARAGNTNNARSDIIFAATGCALPHCMMSSIRLTAPQIIAAVPHKLAAIMPNRILPLTTIPFYSELPLDPMLGSRHKTGTDIR